MQTSLRRRHRDRVVRRGLALIIESDFVRSGRLRTLAGSSCGTVPVSRARCLLVCAVRDGRGSPTLRRSIDQHQVLRAGGARAGSHAARTALLAPTPPTRHARRPATLTRSTLTCRPPTMILHTIERRTCAPPFPQHTHTHAHARQHCSRVRLGCAQSPQAQHQDGDEQRCANLCHSLRHAQTSRSLLLLAEIMLYAIAQKEQLGFDKAVEVRPEPHPNPAPVWSPCTTLTPAHPLLWQECKYRMSRYGVTPNSALVIAQTHRLLVRLLTASCLRAQCLFCHRRCFCTWHSRPSRSSLTRCVPSAHPHTHARQPSP